MRWGMGVPWAWAGKGWPGGSLWDLRGVWQAALAAPLYPWVPSWVRLQRWLPQGGMEVTLEQGGGE